eukprot:gnl/TRDRNA2_/TRDRNA2_53233_c0_seq1.p1 gnl/TRDRNA2_/TRDRNA2_53233_c0~~gnl/TRDRNA2_/TRDRNA2_53233_c0_seq1.p1  ORF type:complete len:145 (+),score=37.64 gnl/TRDRNA2_/TRDRNA2_53233_c0_seq1:141-575(+)
MTTVTAASFGPAAVKRKARKLQEELREDALSSNTDAAACCPSASPAPSSVYPTDASTDADALGTDADDVHSDTFTLTDDDFKAADAGCDEAEVHLKSSADTYGLPLAGSSDPAVLEEEAWRVVGQRLACVFLKACEECEESDND